MHYEGLFIVVNKTANNYMAQQDFEEKLCDHQASFRKWQNFKTFC